MPVRRMRCGFARTPFPMRRGWRNALSRTSGSSAPPARSCSVAQIPQPPHRQRRVPARPGARWIFTIRISECVNTRRLQLHGSARRRRSHAPADGQHRRHAIKPHGQAPPQSIFARRHLHSPQSAAADRLDNPEPHRNLPLRGTYAGLLSRRLPPESADQGFGRDR